ncbi:hypothetical protein F4805DRAFT_435953 [Annulohypoxylon moriforme]|nr:hypothetical protein F4805DRAFT_435953 [Annulohypoxylon moriforme]
MDLDTTGSSAGGQAALSGRKSVPYGQACTNCSKAKCKCISRGAPGSICERCQRLGKQCVPSVSVRKRAVRRPAAERTAHLEEKLDDLVSILRAQAAGTPPTGAYRAGASDDLPDPGIDTDTNSGPAMDLDPSIGVVPVPADKATSNAPLSLPPPVEAFCSRFTSMNSYPTPPSIASSQDGGPSPVEAEEILRVFQDRFVPFFPFVWIPPETTAAQLQQERPFLWLTITCTCSKSQEKKAAYSQKIREYLAQKMLIDLDRNIDLLLGMVCYLGWGMHHFTGKPYINAYINMAVTVVADLRLDKPPQDNFFRELHCFKPTYGYPKVLSTHRTNEERRATLACFILCSGISNFLRTQTMRWTPHMEDSLQKLATSPETPNDSLLVAMVRTYRIQEDVAQITWRAADHSGNSLKAPPYIYVKALRANLEAVKQEVPASLKDNKVFLSHISAAEIAIADMSLWNVNPWLTAHPPRPGPVSGSSGGIDMGKLDAYYSSLQASKASLENFLSFAPGEYMSLSMSLTLHFGRATQTVYRLMVVDDPEWDRNIVKDSIDLMSVMERTATRFLQVPQICGIEVSEDPEMLDYYTKAANALRATIPSWTATLEQLGCASGCASAAAANTPAPGAGVEAQFQSGQAIPELSSMEWLDDPWLTDMLRSWEGS